MRKRLIVMMLLAVMVLSQTSMSASADWKSAENGMMYRNENGYVRGLVQIDGKFYFFNEAGIMQTGPQWWDGEMYYFSMMDGTMQKGWIYAGSLVYYADPVTGVLYRNRSLGNHYFLSDGTMAGRGSGTGTGTAAGGWVTKGGKTYYYGASGTYVTGLQTIDGNQYYFRSNGVLQKKRWITAENGKRYYCSQNGTIAKDQWIDNKTYYVTATGEMAKGLTAIGKRLYYFNPVNGKLKKNGRFKDASGAPYVANKNGVVLRSHFFKVNGKTYYAEANGKLASGLKTIEGEIYFFKQNSNRMVTGGRRSVNGNTYYFQSDGKAAKDRWVKISGNYYYFLSDGKMAKNQYIGTKWYVGADGVRVKKTVSSGGLQKNGNKTYVVGSDGKKLTNQWATVNGNKYYCGADGAIVTGLQTIGGVQYAFSSEGVLQISTVVVVGSTCYYTDAAGAVTKTGKVSNEAIVAYAKKWVGHPYVYGGTSLENGADCSGFVMKVLEHFGIRILRVADDQRKGPSESLIKQGYTRGYSIKVSKLSDLAPGDLVFYGSESSNGAYASHVAMYIGDGKIVHAANSRVGIIISEIDYMKGRLSTAMRYWA